MNSDRFDPAYHLALSARAQLLGVREGDPDETRTLLQGFVEEAASGGAVEAESLDLLAWMVGRVLDGADPAQVFTPPPLAQPAAGNKPRQALQKRRRERMIRLVAQDARAELAQGGKPAAVVQRLAKRAKLPKDPILAALKALADSAPGPG